jgi:Glycosyl hydrolase family 115/Gylcosyl hydrolase family 115 C-terminal domain
MKGVFNRYSSVRGRQVALAIGILFFNNIQKAYTSNEETYVSFAYKKNWFCLADSSKVASILVSSVDYTGVLKIAQLFREDIFRVVKINPDLIRDSIPLREQIILIGTLDKNPLIKRLIDEKKLDVSGLFGCWEKFIICTVKNPFPGVKQALVITGSDKRGTMYGMFDLSARMGVSPWYWWADVPVNPQTVIYIQPLKHTLGEPAVRYRGFFINDEAPCLSGWVQEKYGGFNHQFYEKVFELLLRLKANYLWPAMWGNAFNDDDTLNPRLADEYGIIMGTSHHEPMLRAQQEWKRYGKGEWNYEKNDSFLREFWRQGIRNKGKHESIITVGMRGDGDLPMSEESNISLLERIIRDQRNILKEVTAKEPSTIPQLWALYKEVQEYYNKGMRVPDDVTLLFCDDNWGNIRRLPSPEDKKHPGGYGVYYHFDYVGGPRNYKWLNTNQVSRIWEQMHLAYEYGVDRIWIVNVGDIKPMELPVSFFFDYAWSPADWPVERMQKYTELWAGQQFGSIYSSRIAHILTQYTNFNSRRKPELLSPETYSLLNYHEADSIIASYNELTRQATILYKEIPQSYKDAFYQLVLFPVKICANLNELYNAAALNHLYASQGRVLTNKFAEKVEQLFTEDAELSREYNKSLGHGKWNHMMDQTHIGYTNWQQPAVNNIPPVKRIIPLTGADPGMSLEGSASFWTSDSITATASKLDRWQKVNTTLDLFNRGNKSYTYTISSAVPWLLCKPEKGTVTDEKQLQISVDWQKVPPEADYGFLLIKTNTGIRFKVQVPILNRNYLSAEMANRFLESGGYISMEAEHYSRIVEIPPYKWICIPDLGRTLSGVTLFPVKRNNILPNADAAHLEYDVYMFSHAEIKVNVYVSPTQNFLGGEGLRYAIAFDDDQATIVNIHEKQSVSEWEKNVAENINKTTTGLTLDKPGCHTLKIWLLDPGIILQKIVIETGHIGDSYLGPPESFHAFKIGVIKNN